MQQPWWKKSVVYQIYPKSFNDSTGNGIGDLQGIIQKLDYLTKLGVDVIWLTPVYQSPQRDNGYDISDYYSIHEEYGSMEDFQQLLTEAHVKGIKIIMDLVVNHTSTEHEWFKKAAASTENAYRDYYIWKDEPNNWLSKFGGSAWKLDERTGQYYLHLFDETQADLNWENPKLRQDIYEMMHFWFKKGIDGFRLDVINLISKDQRYADDDGSMLPGDGRKFYTDGPRVHEYLQEMNREVLSHYEALTVGEMSSTTIEDCIQYSNPDRAELSMTFNFHHLKVDYPNGEKWAVGEMDFLALKRILSTWQTEMQHGGGWNALFWCNHDQPRIVSRYGDDGIYHKQSAKMLATTIHMMQGTPYIYQGEEFGMTNPKFTSMNQYRDVETMNQYRLMKEAGKTEEEIIPILQEKSRDNSRTPVQWNHDSQAGFTSGIPWIPVAANYPEINAESALNDEESIFYHYQKLIMMRKEYAIITDGAYRLLEENHPHLFVYERVLENEVLLVINNFYSEMAELVISEELISEYQHEMLLANVAEVPELTKKIDVGPYQSYVYHFKK